MTKQRIVVSVAAFVFAMGIGSQAYAGPQAGMDAYPGGPGFAPNLQGPESGSETADEVTSVHPPNEGDEFSITVNGQGGRLPVEPLAGSTVLRRHHRARCVPHPYRRGPARRPRRHRPAPRDGKDRQPCARHARKMRC